jgi:iron(III) transport system permease protein
VTDFMQVPTFADEIYVQLNMGGDSGLRGAVLAALPTVVLTWLLLLWVLPRWRRSVPPPGSLLTPSPLFRLGKWRGIAFLAAFGTAAILVGVPLGSLIWKLGAAGRPSEWILDQAVTRWLVAWRLHGGLVVTSLALALGSGLLTSALALLLCWLALDRPWFRGTLFAVLAAVWALPGLLVGLGLKETFVTLAAFEPFDALLYRGPSYAPVVLGYLVRFLPCAVAALWPVVRWIPAGLRDAARVEGARPRQEFMWVFVPLLRRPALAVAMLVAALALGELPVNRLVETPGAFTFVRELGDRMHYGPTADVAALCLVMLAMVLGLAAVCFVARRFLGRFP